MAGVGVDVAAGDSVSVVVGVDPTTVVSVLLDPADVVGPVAVSVAVAATDPVAVAVADPDSEPDVEAVPDVVVETVLALPLLVDDPDFVVITDSALSEYVEVSDMVQDGASRGLTVSSSSSLGCRQCPVRALGTRSQLGRFLGFQPSLDSPLASDWHP